MSPAGNSANERQLRLQLNDAARTSSALSTVRRETDDREKRNAINREVADIAQSALRSYYDADVDRGRFRRLRKEAERRREGRPPGRLQGRRLQGRDLESRNLEGRKLQGRNP